MILEALPKRRLFAAIYLHSQGCSALGVNQGHRLIAALPFSDHWDHKEDGGELSTALKTSTWNRHLSLPLTAHWESKSRGQNQLQRGQASEILPYAQDWLKILGSYYITRIVVNIF